MWELTQELHANLENDLINRNVTESDLEKIADYIQLIVWDHKRRTGEFPSFKRLDEIKAQYPKSPKDKMEDEMSDKNKKQQLNEGNKDAAPQDFPSKMEVDIRFNLQEQRLSDAQKLWERDLQQTQANMVNQLTATTKVIEERLDSMSKTIGARLDSTSQITITRLDSMMAIMKADSDRTAKLADDANKYSTQLMFRGTALIIAIMLAGAAGMWGMHQSISNSIGGRIDKLPSSLDELKKQGK